MRVIFETRVSVPVSSAGETMDMIFGVYEVPVLGKLYSVRTPLSNIISIGVLPNDVKDEEAIHLASRVFEQSRKELHKFLMVRNANSVEPLEASLRKYTQVDTLSVMNEAERTNEPEEAKGKGGKKTKAKR